MARYLYCWTHSISVLSSAYICASDMSVVCEMIIIYLVLLAFKTSFRLTRACCSSLKASLKIGESLTQSKFGYS
uniref:Uncharacterized protein n=1 Tax=Anguilla anguilla TaxID=7936 RepID=A0A0E9R4T6_ANGAN